MYHRPLYALLVVAVCFIAVSARKIEDCCCEAETVDVGNDQELHDRLQELRAQTFFKIFKVDLHSECPFWHQENVCHRQGCSVCPCEDNEIPEQWKEEEKQKAAIAAAAAPKANPWSAGLAGAKPKKPAAAAAPAAGGEGDGRTSLVDRTLAPSDFAGWSEVDDTVWIAQRDGPDSKCSFINLALNPEGYTGYEGKEAWRIWDSIYGANCFRGDKQDFCLEQRVLYRLVSGLHSTIAAHTAERYDISPGVVGMAPEIFEQKLGKHPERIQNLYFAFVFLLRAVHKASPLLYDYAYSTGNLSNDLAVKHMMQILLDSRMVRSCLPEQSFDESTMFSRPDTKPLKAQFKEHFRNISSIMDCVSCEKCKMHGKLQVLGLGTALRILFSERSLVELKLQRNEVIALIVTLAKFSHAIRIVHQFQSGALWFTDPNVIIIGIVALVTLLTVALVLLGIMCMRRGCRFKLRICGRRRTANATPTAADSKDD